MVLILVWVSTDWNFFDGSSNGYFLFYYYCEKLIIQNCCYSCYLNLAECCGLHLMNEQVDMSLAVDPLTCYQAYLRCMMVHCFDLSSFCEDRLLCCGFGYYQLDTCWLPDH